MSHLPELISPFNVFCRSFRLPVSFSLALASFLQWVSCLSLSADHSHVVYPIGGTGCRSE